MLCTSGLPAFQCFERCTCSMTRASVLTACVAPGEYAKHAFAALAEALGVMVDLDQLVASQPRLSAAYSATQQ